MLRQSVGSVPLMSPAVSREMEEFLLSTPINPNNFPAKLWRIVNSPRYRSIRWDPRGEGLIVDQQLFESELLAPIKNISNGAKLEPNTDLLFKTTNFTSFIRQLNLYGFRKLGQGSSEHPVPGELGAGDGLLHHFHNPSFKQDHPELLINMKRLTSANKAKLAAGLQVNTRPPNRFQRYLTNSMDSIGQTKGDRHGPVTVGQLQRTFRRDNLSPYPFLSSTHNQSPLHTVSIKNLSGSNPGGLDRTPIPPRTWHSSIGLMAGQIDTTSSSPFSDKAIPFSVIQRFPTEVTYSLQPNPNSVHVQGSQEIGSAGQKYTSYLTSPSQYHQAFYPTAVLQCCTPNSHLDPLAGCPNTNASSYPNYNYYQIVDELRASPTLQMVKMDDAENAIQMQESQNTQQTPSSPTFTENAGANIRPMEIQTLTTAVSEIKSFVVAAADEPLSCSLPAVADSVLTTMSKLSENTTTVSIVPEPVASDQCLTHDEVHKLCHNTSLHPIMFVEDGTESISETTVHGTNYHTGSLDPVQTSDRSRTIISALLSDFDLPKDTVTANTRQQNSGQQAKSPDLHLLVDVACNQDHFQKEEDICVWETEASHSPQLSP